MHHALFATDTLFRHDAEHYPPQARAVLLRALGFAGATATLDNKNASQELPTLLECLDANGLQLLSIRLAADVSVTELNPHFAPAVALLAGRRTLVELELFSRSPHDVPSSPRADVRGAEIVTRLVGMTKDAGLRIALHPRPGRWLERVEHAVRLGMRVNRPEVGLTFNVGNWLSADGQELDARLQLALPRLWNVVLPPASAGFDVSTFLYSLARMGYAGPLTLEPDNDLQDPREALRRAVEVYRKVAQRLVRQ